MKLNYFDIHSHLNDKQFDNDRVEVITELEKQGIGTIIVGTDKEMSKKACEISLLSNGLFVCIGQHPVDKPDEEFDISFYQGLIEKYSKIVAVGECGLDYFRLGSDVEKEKARQKKLIEQQIEFAVQNSLPLMIHVRESKNSTDANNELIDIFQSKKMEYGDELKGNIHFFAGDVDLAKRYFNLDFTISFTGVITFTNDYNEVIKFAPIDKIMSETDSPYVAPIPHRGQRNSPLYVPEVVKKIAEIRGEDFEVVQKTMIENAMRVFNCIL